MKETEWLSLHVFYHDVERIEPLFMETISPLLQSFEKDKLIEKWFFIRYWEGGPHLRIRLLNASAIVEQRLRKAIRTYMDRYPYQSPLTKEKYYSNHKMDGERKPIDTLPWYEHGEVVSIPYHAELGRYGGTHAMPTSESLFHQSSLFVYEIIKQTGTDRSKRLAIALDNMLITARLLGVSEEELNVYFARYADYWETFVDKREAVMEWVNQSYDRQKSYLQQRLKTIMSDIRSVCASEKHLLQQTLNESTLSIYNEWFQALTNAHADYYEAAANSALISPFGGQKVSSQDETKQAIQGICFSQIHMTNNRLGVFPWEEFYLAKMIEMLTHEMKSLEV